MNTSGSGSRESSALPLQLHCTFPHSSAPIKMKRISGPLIGEVTGGSRKCHNEKFHNSLILFIKYFVMRTNKTRKMIWAGM
jgi:hypothetical protein